ncbi:MAG: ATP-binding protein, partial [Anaerovoracaceae bacterium]
MYFFRYDKDCIKAEYYELLQFLMENWENEIVEFKEAKGQYSADRIGQYFSAISNEANLKNQQYGWLVLGVSEKDKKHLVGTSYKKGEGNLLEKFKYEIAKETTDGISFIDIVELNPIDEKSNKTYRVLMFKIPAAVSGMPTAWKNRYYARAGESLVFMQQYKIDQIRNQERRDWSKMILGGASIAHLDNNAIALARAKYKEKMQRDHISEEVDNQSDEEFLTQLKLIVDGKITNAAMILLGREECDYYFESPPKIMWRLYGADGSDKDYEIFSIPF